MITYVVKNGDTLTDIALRFLKSAARWREIAQLNQLSNPNLLYVGQGLRIPEPAQPQPQPGPGPSLVLTKPIPASVALARGFMFVVFEQLPHIGANLVIRKVAAVPRDFSLLPRQPLGTMTLAEHVLNVNPAGSPFLSTSAQPFGAPSITGQPLLIDVAKIKAAGGEVFTVEEVVADLRRFAAENPSAARRVNTLISTIEKVEGEVLIRGPVQLQSKATLSSPHLSYVRSAEDLWRAHTEGKITRPQLEVELQGLGKAYSRARVMGNVGRGLMVIGVVITAVDLGLAADRSINQRSFKPIGAEVIRQVGGWGAAFAGGKIGFGLGALCGIETGPGAIVTGAIGAVVFGAAGYFGADWVADHISPN